MKRQRSPLLRMFENAKPLIVWRFVVLFIAMCISIATPLFSQVFVDSIITHKHPEWEVPMVVMLSLILVISLLNVFFGQYYSKKLLIKYRIEYASRTFWHALRLPMGEYGRMSVDDIINRYTKGEITFSQFMNSVLPVINSGIQILIMLTLMILYSPVLSLISLLSVVVNAVTMFSSYDKQRAISKKMEESHVEMERIISSGVKNIEAVKSAGAEGIFFRSTMNYFTKFINLSAESSRMMVNFNLLPTFLQQATSVISLCIGASLIIRGELTVGLLMAFQGFLNQFLMPVSALTRVSQTIITANSRAKRTMEMMDIKPDVDESIVYDPESEMSKLKGAVELRNVTFGYDRNMPPLIQNLSLKIEPGKSIALVGGSGSGKSTIANLVTGLYQPWEGEVLFDGKKRSEINRYCFYNSVSVVNQEIVLFEGTVADNIKMWDEVTDDSVMIKAAEAAQIHEEIISRPDGYNSPVEGGGSNFSGGQRQRIEIATALAKEPRILIMDEATSALDPTTENKLMSAVRQMNITTLIVAHRLSTIRDCDEILVMERGHVVDRGTHEQLMQHKDGLYYKLMQMN